MHALAAQAVKGEARLGSPSDNLGLLDLVVRLEPEPGDLVLQELMNALHGLAGAGNPEALLGPGNQQVLGYRPGLDAATVTIQDFATPSEKTTRHVRHG
jgi:hypothetical protein